MTDLLSLIYYLLILKQVNSGNKKEESHLEDYICLRVQDDASVSHQNVVIILRDFTMSDFSVAGAKVPQVLALRFEKTLHCIDLALYKVLNCQVIVELLTWVTIFHIFQ